MANKTRPYQLIFRATEKEKNKIQDKVKKSKLNQNEYLLRSALDKKIVVIDGLDEFVLEIRRIGNNLNQLTRLAHEGKVNCKNELAEIEKEMGEVWQLLSQLVQKQV